MFQIEIIVTHSCFSGKGIQGFAHIRNSLASNGFLACPNERDLSPELALNDLCCRCPFQVFCLKLSWQFLYNANLIKDFLSFFAKAFHSNFLYLFIESIVNYCTSTSWQKYLKETWKFFSNHIFPFLLILIINVISSAQQSAFLINSHINPSDESRPSTESSQGRHFQPVQNFVLQMKVISSNKVFPYYHLINQMGLWPPPPFYLILVNLTLMNDFIIYSNEVHQWWHSNLVMTSLNLNSR